MFRCLSWSALNFTYVHWRVMRTRAGLVWFGFKKKQISISKGGFEESMGGSYETFYFKHSCTILWERQLSLSRVVLKTYRKNSFVLTDNNSKVNLSVFTLLLSDPFHSLAWPKISYSTPFTLVRSGLFQHSWLKNHWIIQQRIIIIHLLHETWLQFSFRLRITNVQSRWVEGLGLFVFFSRFFFSSFASSSISSTTLLEAPLRLNGGWFYANATEQFSTRVEYLNLSNDCKKDAGENGTWKMVWKQTDGWNCCLSPHQSPGVLP